MVMLPSLTSHAMTAAIFLPFHTCDVGPWLKVCHERDGMSLIVVIYDRYRTRLCIKILFFILVFYNHNTICTLPRTCHVTVQIVLVSVHIRVTLYRLQQNIFSIYVTLSVLFAFFVP